MKHVIVIFDLNAGTIDGYKDISQASGVLGMSSCRLLGLLDGNIHYTGSKFVGQLNLHKSNRGGDRT